MTVIYIALVHFLLLGAGVGTLVKICRRDVVVDRITMPEVHIHVVHGGQFVRGPRGAQ